MSDFAFHPVASMIGETGSIPSRMRAKAHAALGGREAILDRIDTP